jgi:hypothetical protein
MIRAKASFRIAYPTNSHNIIKEKPRQNANVGIVRKSEALVFDRSNCLATLADQNNPTSKIAACSKGLNQETSGDQLGEEILNKFQPHPSGSESTDKTYDIFGKAKEMVKAIQAHNPSGSRICDWLAIDLRSGTLAREIFVPAHTDKANNPGRTRMFSARKPNAYFSQLGEPISKAANFRLPHGPVKTAEKASAEPNIISARKASSKRSDERD